MHESSTVLQLDESRSSVQQIEQRCALAHLLPAACDAHDRGQKQAAANAATQSPGPVRGSGGAGGGNLVTHWRARRVNRLEALFLQLRMDPRQAELLRVRACVRAPGQSHRTCFASLTRRAQEPDFIENRTEVLAAAKQVGKPTGAASLLSTAD